MPTSVVNTTPGHSVTLTAVPTIGGQPPAQLPPPGTVTWSTNASNINVNVTLTPSQDTMTCVLNIPMQSLGGTVSFSVFARCGSLSSTIVIALSPPPTADGITINYTVQ